MLLVVGIIKYYVMYSKQSFVLNIIYYLEIHLEMTFNVGNDISVA